MGTVDERSMIPRFHPSFRCPLDFASCVIPKRFSDFIVHFMLEYLRSEALQFER